jgi:UDPglucose 6-dehydrogenase
LVAYNPEFLRQEHALNDFLHPERIIIGGRPSSRGIATARSLYQGFEAPILETSWNLAEMAKLVANSFLATRISFFNEIGMVCDRLGVSSRELFRIVGLGRRIGPYGTEPGRPFGGKCLPKDLDCMISVARTLGLNTKILSATKMINETITEALPSQVNPMVQRNG